VNGDKSGFASAAKKVLSEVGKPLHAKEITALALKKGYLKTEGKTPAATMQAILAVAVKTKGNKSPFVRVRPGIYGLYVWGVDDVVYEEKKHNIRVPHYPLYESLAALLPILQGVRRAEFTGLKGKIWQLTGTPQSNLDWTDPDNWIPERLDGEQEKLAMKIWKVSSGKVNPRHMTGHWLLANNYKLLEEDAGGRLVVTESGQDFINNPDGNTVQNIDDQEGVLKILSLVAQAAPVAFGALLEPWSQYLASESHVKSDSATRERLRARLRNLLHRGFLDRTGHSYLVTEQGLKYLDMAGYGEGSSETEEDKKITSLIRAQHASIRDTIRGLLAEIDPIAFEHLIKDLLEAIGYEDVEVTSPSGDKGVDVLGSIELGITSVREVVQVKRHGKNIQRNVLDALRGSLHRFGAVRGSIITIGDFASGTKKAAFEPGAAPITLINGEKLIDLLIEHGLGVTKRKLELWELDTSTFQSEDEGEGGSD
jgi:restriction system protein